MTFAKLPKKPKQIMLKEKQYAFCNASNQILNLNSQMQQTLVQRNSLLAARQPHLIEIARIDRECAPLIRDWEEKNQRYRAYERDVSDCETRLRQIGSIFTANQETIRRIEIELNEISTGLNRLDESQLRLRQQLATLAPQFQRLWAEYGVADNQAAQTEAVTGRSYDRYVTVKAKYDGLWNAGASEGSAQGTELGRRDGAQRGTGVGGDAASSQGGLFGAKVAGLESFERGLAQGLQTGTANGYKAGFELPANRQKGLEAGLKAGLSEALAILEATVYVDAGVKFKAEALKARLEKWVDLANEAESKTNAAAGSLNSEGTTRSSEFRTAKLLSAYAPEVREIEDADEKFRRLISLARAELATVKTEMDRLSKTQVSPDGVNVPAELANCRQGFADFVQACQQAFNESYRTKYMSSYGKSYLEARNERFAGVYQKALLDNQNSRLQEGVDASYPVVFAKHQSMGAADAENSGYREGHANGLAEKDNPERIQATRNRGTGDERNFFSQNPVLRIQGVSVEALDKATGLVPGARVMVKVDAANFGGLDSKRSDVRMSLFTYSNSVRFSKTTTQLVEICSRTGAHVSRVFVGQISPDAA